MLSIVFPLSFRFHPENVPASRTGLSVTYDDPLVSGQFLQSHRTAGMQFLCTDAEFGSHAKFAAVGKGSRGIHIHTSGIDALHEVKASGLVFGHDALAMPGSVLLDVQRRWFR